MHRTYLSYNSIFSSLGTNSATVVDQMLLGKTGLKEENNTKLLPVPFIASYIPQSLLEKTALEASYTKLERMMITALGKVLDNCSIPLNDRVGLIISTTKGNIDALDQHSNFPKERAYLSQLGARVQQHFGFTDQALVLSNACVSGVLGVAVAKRLIRQGRYDHVFIVGGDLVSRFTLSGFHSFQAMSPVPCKPYDKDRNGINIGEVAVAALVTIDDQALCPEAVEILGDGSCNDANHISGPSRTGEGLYQSIRSALDEAKLSPLQLDYISAHGTATLYNDEMEAIAFDRLGLASVPINSLKGYFGHTLGASGLLESIVGMHSLHRNTLITSLGMETLGVSRPINIIAETKSAPLNYFLKTASGFGGCNTAVVFKKAG